MTRRRRGGQARRASSARARALADLASASAADRVVCRRRDGAGCHGGLAVGQAARRVGGVDAADEVQRGADGLAAVRVEHQHLAQMRAQPNELAPIKAEAERGVIARLEDCSAKWCEIRADGAKGWVHEGDLWGVTLDNVETAAVLPGG